SWNYFKDAIEDERKQLWLETHGIRPGDVFGTHRHLALDGEHAAPRQVEHEARQAEPEAHEQGVRAAAEAAIDQLVGAGIVLDKRKLLYPSSLRALRHQLPNDLD